MSLRRHRRLIVAGAAALALGTTAVTLAPQADPSEPDARTERVDCPDAGYTRDELMNVVHAYRQSLDRGRRTLMAVDQGKYWASYDRCDEDGD
jgi:hypothetical protein